MNKKVYISGKVTGSDDYVERFARAEKILKERGYDPINPVAVNAALPPDTPWLEYMRTSLAMLMREDCKAIYMLDGWEYSTGASVEWRIAQGGGYEVLYETE